MTNGSTVNYRLKAVRENGAAVETYGYDALGRRAWTASGSVTNYYAYDGAQVIADLDANGQVVRSYIHAPGIDRLLAIVVHGAVTTKYACLTDHLGTVHALADETGNIVETYEYDAWGNLLAVRDGGGNLLPTSAIGNRYLFQGREYSWATGLYNFRARWYDPETGRWLSNDPIGISGGLDQYCFCGDNSVNYVDPDGRDVYKINVSYTTYWAVDTPSGGVEMYHYSGKSWNRGSGQWRVFWKDQAEVGRFQDPTAFLQEYFPDMPRTAEKLADSWRGKRYKKTCGEDAAILEKFREAEKNEANLFYNAVGIGADNCSSFGKTIMKQALPPVPR